jgi:1-deoxy-D-xylulose-5-phosphate reductoisomerase
LDWRDGARLDFTPPDPIRYPALSLGYDVARAGGTAGAVFNAANEVAVGAFLSNQIGLGMIQMTVARTLDAITVIPHPSMDDLMEADARARRTALSLLGLHATTAL